MSDATRTKDQILMRCPACPAQRMVSRVPYDYPEAVVIEVHCDRHNSADAEASIPKYFDAAGNHITRDPEAA